MKRLQLTTHLALAFSNLVLRKVKIIYAQIVAFMKNIFLSSLLIFSLINSASAMNPSDHYEEQAKFISFAIFTTTVVMSLGFSRAPNPLVQCFTLFGLCYFGTGMAEIIDVGPEVTLPIISAIFFIIRHFRPPMLIEFPPRERRRPAPFLDEWDEFLAINQNPPVVTNIKTEVIGEQVLVRYQLDNSSPQNANLQIARNSKYEIENCPVCLGEWDEKIMVSLPCHHGICTECLGPSLSIPSRGINNRCPLCRATVLEN